jgi:hypothetical protein
VIVKTFFSAESRIRSEMGPANGANVEMVHLPSSRIVLVKTESLANVACIRRTANEARGLTHICLELDWKFFFAIRFYF